MLKDKGRMSCKRLVCLFEHPSGLVCAQIHACSALDLNLRLLRPSVDNTIAAGTKLRSHLICA